MAADKQKKRYEKKRLDVIKKLKAKGFIAEFGNPGGRVNHGLPGDFEELCQEPVFQVEGETVFDDEIEAGDAVYMVGNESKALYLPITDGKAVIACSKMKTGTGERKIFKDQPFFPDGENIIFTWVLLRE